MLSRALWGGSNRNARSPVCMRTRRSGLRSIADYGLLEPAIYSMKGQPVTESVGDLVRSQIQAGVDVIDPREGALNGFGGMHGGLVGAACLAAAKPRGMEVDWAPLKLDVHFLRGVRGVGDLLTTSFRWGKRTGYSEVEVEIDGESAIRSAITWMNAGDGKPTTHRWQPPGDFAAIDDCEEFVVPREFVPIAPLFTIRPAAGQLPYTGAAESRLCAWVNYNDESMSELTPEVITILSDSLAPSIAATFNELVPVPTVDMSVTFCAVTPPRGPVLIECKSAELGSGWVSEIITMWDIDLNPIAQACQTRIIVQN